MGEKLKKTKLDRALDRDLRRMKAVIDRVKKMDYADRYYLLSRLKAKECVDVHIAQQCGL